MNALDDELWRLGFSRRERRRAARIAEATLDWHKGDGFDSVAKCDLSYGSVEDVKGLAVESVVVGLLLRLVAGWLIELVVGWVVDWLLSPQSSGFRSAVGDAR